MKHVFSQSAPGFSGAKSKSRILLRTLPRACAATPESRAAGAIHEDRRNDRIGGRTRQMQSNVREIPRLGYDLENCAGVFANLKPER